MAVPGLLQIGSELTDLARPDNGVRAGQRGQEAIQTTTTDSQPIQTTDNEQQGKEPIQITDNEFRIRSAPMNFVYSLRPRVRPREIEPADKDKAI